MDDVRKICGNLEDFNWWLFEGCMQQERTRGHLGISVEARLHDGRRKTHQPAGMRLARSKADADALRQRINRGYLAEWSDSVVRQRLLSVAQAVMPEAFALIIDDTGIEKKGTKSPGVQRQYTGTAGKVTNCQVVVSTHLASWDASVPVEMDVYLPDEAWCRDQARRSEAWIPDEVVFRTKPELALAQVDRLLEAGVGPAVTLADAGYGDNTDFRRALDDRGVAYAVGLSGTMKVWRAGEGPDPTPPPSGRLGRPQKRRFPGKYEPVEIRSLATELDEPVWRLIELRPGEENPRTSRFAALRVRAARRAHVGWPPGPERWLLVEWPEGDSSPSHFFLSSMPADTPIEELARTAKHRWRVERDYQDAKQEVGLDQYEGRRWTGLNHHLTICMAAMTYLVASRALFPPHGKAVAG